MTQTEVEVEGDRSPPRPREPGVVGIFAEGGEPLPATPITEPVVAGRAGGGATIALDDGKVSRRHLELTPAPEGLWVRDLGSRNGSRLNGHPLTAEATLAPPGSLLQAGRQLLWIADDVTPHRHRHLPIPGKLRGGPGLAAVREALRRLAPTDLTVLVMGESGTGKELVAEALHLASGRTGSLLRVNTAALPSELVESELFGHARGAFSSSDRARPGLFRQADGGTLVLDEVGELPMAAQAKLLRVLEERQVRPVGEDAPVTVDVRVVASTNRDLRARVEAGQFRLDLYHRLAASHILVPPLRSRRDDIPLLASGFATEGRCKLSANAAAALTLQAWPGNVRQLRNAVRVAVAAATAAGRERIGVDDLQLEDGLEMSTALPASPTPMNVRDEERHRLDAELRRFRGNVAQVSRATGIARSQLYVLLKRYQLDPATYRR